jgi:threonyl-tRNA synthetase
MIHRALMGSIERFFGILVEHFAGAFPTWLAPVQAKILPITEKQESYGKIVQDQVKALGYRVDVDLRNEKIGLKIREAEKAKIPYMFVIGERECESHSVSVRKRGGENLGSMAVQEAINLMRDDMPSGTLTSSSH